MAISIGAWRGTLSLDTSGFRNSVTDAQSVTAVFGQTITTLVNNPLLGTIEILKQAATAAVRVAGDTLDYAETISRVASEADITAGTLQTMREALEDAGRGADGAQAAAQRFSVRLGELKDGTGSAADEFRELKLDPATFRDTDDAIRRTIEALAAMEDRTRAGTLAAGLFERQYGKSIVEAVRKAGGSLDELRESFGAAILDDRTLSDLGKLDDTLDNIGNVMQSLSRAAPAALLSGFAEGLGTINPDVFKNSQDAVKELIPLFRDLGREIGEAASAVKDLIGSLEGLPGVIDFGATVARGVGVLGTGVVRNDTIGEIADSLEDVNRDYARRVVRRSLREIGRTGGAK